MRTRLSVLPVVAALSFTALTYGAAAHAAPSPSPSPVGSGCGALPKSGPGSLSEIANEPLVTAASHIPQLSTLVSAVKKAGLEDAANSAKDITVFAPTNDAFAKIPKDQFDKIAADKRALARLLGHHIVEGRKSPADFKNGGFTTLEGSRVTTSVSDDTYKVGDAKVVCGNIQTRNATLYIIDSVLKPRG
ncbi:fasciclin domain-containing protein [Sphaerisporangium album]|uniref:Fasciclin domain-containing protein n=1 Tax=Sphaerisporangium album TaxID=509200 RepID=A0A367FU04_9ACTN|nr:fasciclin domain-containing protein [Sphaerisporangium album]RCG33187.1 fasciclin domain-containing protein [Sphaerisporangium album]